MPSRKSDRTIRRIGSNGWPYYTKTERRNKYLEGEERPLSRRQVEVAILRANGKSYREIAEILGIACKTVDSHLYRIKEKVGSISSIKLLVYCLNHRLLTQPTTEQPEGEP